MSRHNFNESFYSHSRLKNSRANVYPKDKSIMDIASIITLISLEKENSKYTGACLRLMRSSDSAESDFGFKNKKLDVDAIYEWGQSDILELVSWYDQTGLGNHWHQNSDLNHPLFVSGKIQFDAQSLHFMNIADYSYLTEGESFALLKLKNFPPPSSVRGGLWKLGTSNADTHFPLSNSLIYDDFGSNVRKALGTSPIDLSSYSVYNPSSKINDWSARFNGTLHFNTTSNTVSFPSSATFGKGVTDFYLDGNLDKFYMFSEVLSSSDRSFADSLLAPYI